jgi:hypothetical protein
MKILLDITFRSVSGQSIHRDVPAGKQPDPAAYSATKETREEAVKSLKKIGFEIIGPPSPFGVSIMGTDQLVQSVFGDDPFVIPDNLAKWIDTVRRPPKGEFFASQK